MKRRCDDPRRPEYPRYGGRGISYDPRWASFEAFAADMGPHPGKGWTLEREDNNGNYEPGNCKWATMKEQSNNRRRRNPVPRVQQVLELHAQGKGYREIGEIVGLQSKTVWAYVKKWKAPNDV